VTIDEAAAETKDRTEDGVAIGLDDETAVGPNDGAAV
jgi:hypothetical protein